VGRQRFADPAVHLAGAVERCGVDVVDAEFDRAAQRRDRVVERGLEQLHRAIADAGHRVGADAAGAAEGWLVRHGCSSIRETLVRMRRTLRLFDCSRNGGSSTLIESVRSDARRNREKLLEVATAAFAAADGRPVSLESIARHAGVGIGTLYRHFPNREALVEAIYRTELAEVAAAAERLLKRHPPKMALRRWMDRYASFVAAKRGMAESLHAMFDSGAMKPSQTRDGIVGTVDVVLRAGGDEGSLPSDVQADDVVSSLIGIFLASGSPEQTGRLLDLLVAGVAPSGIL